MEKRKAILIPCPQYGRLVRGSCACDEEGRYRRGPEGEFILDHVRCDQLGGRCMETLCALHRHNRRGPGTWFPGGPGQENAQPRRTQAHQPRQFHRHGCPVL